MTTDNELTINLCVPSLRVADVRFNSTEIRRMIDVLIENEQNFQMIVFPQLSLSGYSCGDLFGMPLLEQACLEALKEIEAAIAGRECLVVIGLPLQIDKKIYDAVTLLDGTGL